MVAIIRDFLEFLLVKRGASANTVIAYDHDLRQLAHYLSGRLRKPGDIPWHAVDRATVDRFIQHLKKQGYGDSSVARKLAVVRRFFAFLAAKGIVASNPAAGVPSPRPAKPVRRSLARRDIERLLEQPTWRNTPEAKRDRAMLELLCATGMRVSELVSLDVGSLQLGPAPSVRCSGRKLTSRTIPIHSGAVDALHTYLESARPILVLGRKEMALFVNQRGERISRQGIWVNFKKYALAAGLSSAIAPRTLRYSYACHMLSEGVSLSEVQGMLGHADIATTRAYLSSHP